MDLGKFMVVMQFSLVEIGLGVTFLILSVWYLLKRRHFERKEQRLHFRILFGLNTAALLFIGFLLISLTEPYITIEHFRASTTEETVIVEYAAYACGDYYPQLTEVMSGDEEQVAVAEVPFRLALPQGIPFPEETEFAVGGNRFRLKGYRYIRRATNVITGTMTDTPSDRLDVFFWEVITPYSVWESSADETIKRQRSQPVQFFRDPRTLHQQDFVIGHYNPC